MWWLIAAHFIGDWGLQNRWMAENKSKYWEILLAHCLVYTGIISIALEYIGKCSIENILIILISHLMIDFFSSRAYANENADINKVRKILWLDHIGHFLFLGIVNF